MSDGRGMPGRMSVQSVRSDRDTIWAIRFFLDEHRRLRDRALFDIAIDCKLRGCDLVKLRVGDLVSHGSVRERATVIQQKTGRPVQFEIMAEARKSLDAWLTRREGASREFAFPCRSRPSARTGTADILVVVRSRLTS